MMARWRDLEGPFVWGAIFWGCLVFALDGLGDPIERAFGAALFGGLAHAGLKVLVALPEDVRRPLVKGAIFSGCFVFGSGYEIGNVILAGLLGGLAHSPLQRVARRGVTEPGGA